ncbi:MAG: hypothetical protein BKP49_11230 [Treponema sp. CETP13]|nr:MAG: hypothetical protein BKP49_11230 [Treponema sp. CETP13]
MNKPIELLAPAGNRNAFLAAIAAGADAIYFGLEEFNARKRAENIKLADLPFLCATAHVHQCKCYMTLNIIFFEDEFELIFSLVGKAVEAGIDAIIVQDIGTIQFLEQNFPNLAVHVSTQVTTHNTAQIDFLAQFKNVTQINLSRELSLKDIELINAKLAEHHLKSEIFVHGAYCISYSGQCYMSALLYGESGNRGECVQPCRRAYTVDYAGNDEKQTEFTPFNLKDNCAFNVATELAQTGADSFKIEGRIKGAEYVWAVVSAWRKKLDEIGCGKFHEYKLMKKEEVDINKFLQGSFNRGFSDDYLQGRASSVMFASQNGKADEKNKSVFHVGTVISYTADTKQLVLRERNKTKGNPGYGSNIKECGLPIGTKLTIRNPDASFVCSGEITKVISKPGLKTGSATYEFHLTSKPNPDNPLRIARGQVVTAQPLLISSDKLKKLCDVIAASGNRALNDKGVNGGVGINIIVSGEIDDKLTAEFKSLRGKSIIVNSESLLSKAQNRGLSKETLQSKLCAFGGTSYELEQLDCSGIKGMKDGESSLFLPLKELKSMRRLAVKKLDELQDTDTKKQNNNSLQPSKPSPDLVDMSPVDSKAENVKNKYAVVYNNLEALEAERNTKTRLGTKEYEISYRILEIPLEWTSQTEDYVLTHRDVIPLFSAILFAADLDRAERLLSKFSKGQLVWCENSGLAYLAQKKGLKVIVGSNLNATNEHTIETYKTLLGCEAVVLSPDISTEKMVSLQKYSKIGTTIWGYLTSNQLLMQSKQCLVKNIPDENGKLCLKKDCDRDCLLKCNRRVSFKDLQNNHLIGVNRPGFYSALYKKEILNRQSLLCTPYGEKLNAIVNTWIIDARKL